MKSNKVLNIIASAILIGAPATASAYEAGDIIIAGGPTVVNPQEDSSVVSLNGGALTGTTASVNSDTQLGVTITYMLNNSWGIELLAATPFEHEVHGNGAPIDGDGIAEVQHLPPTLSLVHYFNTGSETIRPFAGIGLNYTMFFSEEGLPGLAGTVGFPITNVDLDDSIGLALRVGVDLKLTENWGLNAGLWYIDIDTDATVDFSSGAVVTADVDIDPLVYMIGLSYKF